MLELQTVEAIFARMLTRYGTAWRAKWDGIAPEAVAADWARVLDGVSRNSLMYALGHLPEFVPTAHQFREACRAPAYFDPPQPQLPWPKPSPEEKERVRRLLAETRARLTGLEPRPTHGDVKAEEERVDVARLEELKRQAAAKVADYARQKGLAL